MLNDVKSLTKPGCLIALAVVAVAGIIVGKKYVQDTSSTAAKPGHTIPFLSSL